MVAQLAPLRSTRSEMVEVFTKPDSLTQYPTNAPLGSLQFSVTPGNPQVRLLNAAGQTVKSRDADGAMTGVGIAMI